MIIAAIQKALEQKGIDGWLFCDLHHRDAIAYRILGLPGNQFASRRWYYFVPSRGEPVKVVHQIESRLLDSLPGEKKIYLTWKELLHELEAMLRPGQTIAMQYSPN